MEKAWELAFGYREPLRTFPRRGYQRTRDRKNNISTIHRQFHPLLLLNLSDVDSEPVFSSLRNPSFPAVIE
jgi:hypothetical protein